MKDDSGVKIFNLLGYNILRYSYTADVAVLEVFGHAVYERVGNVSVLFIYGVNIYERVDNACAVFGVGIKLK